MSGSISIGDITDRERRITLIALLVVFLLAALDQTIISTAMPRIIEDLNGLELYAWVTTAYMLTSTVLVPIYGKLGDLYGRKRILIIGVVIFLFGSFLSGLSGEFGTLPLLGDGMHQLIIFRAVKGVGGAALFTSAIAIIADLYPPRERARFMGVFGAVFGLASILGPAMGGLLTDHATTNLFGYHIAGWRWVFYVNMPLGLVALFMIIAKTPTFDRGSGGKIDYPGAALIIIAFVPFLLALTWGGRSYPWLSPVILSLFATTVISLLLFLWQEKRVEHPILPLDLFRIPAFSITNLTTFMISMSFLGVVMFMPLYMQVVQGISATNSGMALFPLMIGTMVSSILAGRWVSKHGRYKAILVGGNFILIIGVILFTQIGPNTGALDLSLRMLVVGLGLGPSQSLVNLIVQSAVSPQHIGVATSSTQFFRQIGSTIGIALFGTFLTHYLTLEIPKNLPQLSGAHFAQMDLSRAQASARNPNAAREQIEGQMNILLAEIESAYHGDDAARRSILNNPILPADFKQGFSDRESLALLNEAQIQQRLSTIRLFMATQVDRLAERMSEGIKLAFSNSITGMYKMALWIVVLGFLISCFVPVIPLHSRVSPTPQPSVKPEPTT
jgi:EmrB/QacA subfamily drug resistance transporter